MGTKLWLALGAASVLTLAGCKNGNGGKAPPPTAECDEPANVTQRQDLLASQPSLGVRDKSILAESVTFQSVAGDSSVACPVSLKFKDLNANGQLDDYENWLLTPQERAADLLARMTPEQEAGLMAHATLTDVPSTANTDVSAQLQSMVSAGHVRFGRTDADTASVTARATWANALQRLCEDSDLGIPFVLSSLPSHSEGNGRSVAAGFSHWTQELGLAATGDLALLEQFGQIAAQEYRAIGVRMMLGPSADLFTEPRWFNGQFTFGEDSNSVADMVAATIRGVQGTTPGAVDVACVVGHFPGAGAATGGWDGRLEKGKYLTYPADNLDAHLVPFARAVDTGVAGIMPAYGIPETGSYSAAGGLIDGSSIEQVGASFNATLLGDVLRGHDGFTGLVISPWGAVEDASVDPLGAPWGVESKSRNQRITAAITAGVDQIGGLNDATPILAGRTAGDITDAQIAAAATRALVLMFELGLFEDPYVDAAQAPALCNTDASYRAGLDAMNRSMVLLVNADKPDGWLNGGGDGTQVGDKGNAGNGSGKVLPAPPGEPYVSAGCSYYITGNFDLDYVRSVSAGYGNLTNDATLINGVTVSTAAERIPLSDYVFIRIDAPFTADPDSGPLGYSEASLEYAGNANADALDDVAVARNAIDTYNAAHPAAPSKTQIIVGVDSGRPAVMDEVLSYGISGLYVEWGVTDKVFLDVAFGIVDGKGTLPVGMPLSDSAVQDPSMQKSDLPGDGQNTTFVRGFGLQTAMFQ